jgi:hypothetical protein
VHPELLVVRHNLYESRVRLFCSLAMFFTCVLRFLVCVRCWLLEN